jgi:hypothetical protein
MRKRRLAAIGLAILAAQLGCSSDSGNDARRHTDAGAGINLDGGAGQVSSLVTITPGADGTCSVSLDTEACTGAAYETENMPLDIYIMMDQTGSMCTCVDPPKTANACPDPTCNKTRIDAIRDAMSQFLADPKSVGIGVGLGFFGQLPIGQISCDPATSANATVSVDLLPGHANSVMTALASVVPTGETPTGAAIRGACSYARSWQQAQPSHKVVILLLTDGLPEAPVSCRTGQEPCCPTLADAVVAADECRNGKPGIATYVLGVGPYLDNLQQIATAGGTSRAYLVGSGDVSADVLGALNQIRGDASIPCELDLPAAPAGTTLALNRVNLVYADSNCQGTAFYHVDNADACGSQAGWYYDDPVAPQRIHLCPTSCAQVSAPVGTLMYAVGCQTVSFVQ